MNCVTYKDFDAIPEWEWICAPESMALIAPLRLGTNAATVRFGMVIAYSTISAVSANWGIIEAGTKEPTSISWMIAVYPANMKHFFQDGSKFYIDFNLDFF